MVGPSSTSVRSAARVRSELAYKGMSVISKHLEPGRRVVMVDCVLKELAFINPCEEL